MSKIKFIKVRNVKSPIRGTSLSSGIDFFIHNDFIPKTLGTWETILIPSWIKLVIEPRYDLVFKEKSWISLKKWLQVWACVIDSDYRWEVNFHFTKVSFWITDLQPWDKIIQWILRKVELDNPLEITDEEFEKECNTERGEWWFGSTWVK